MIDFNVLKTKVLVSPLFFSVLTAVLILDKTGVSGFAVLFSFIHELGHILALICVKTEPENVFVTLFGIHIKLPGNLSTTEKCIVLAAGFSVNFLLAGLFFYFEKTVFAAINLIIGIFTALPLASTDGGAVLKVILEEFFSQKGGKIFKIVSLCFFSAVSVFLVFAAVLTKNYFIFVAVIYMALCAKKQAAG